MVATTETHRVPGIVMGDTFPSQNKDSYHRNPTFYPNLPKPTFLQVPLNFILGFIIRTFRKAGFSSLRNYLGTLDPLGKQFTMGGTFPNHNKGS